MSRDKYIPTIHWNDIYNAFAAKVEVGESDHQWIDRVRQTLLDTHHARVAEAKGDRRLARLCALFFVITFGIAGWMFWQNWQLVKAYEVVDAERRDWQTQALSLLAQSNSVVEKERELEDREHHLNEKELEHARRSREPEQKQEIIPQRKGAGQLAPPR